MARKEYEMTPKQEADLIQACQPVRYMVIGGMEPSSPQENANNAWKALGKELGFIWDTARAVSGKPTRFFSAEEDPVFLEKKEKYLRDSEGAYEVAP
jgi:hypothetical protein